jgi:acetyl-CoA synthetase
MFIGARDFLLQHRDDYPTAYRDFAWPKVDLSNRAIDRFCARQSAQANR